MKKIKYSVVIPSKDELAYVGKCIASVKKQGRRDVEIIVVDSGTDRTMKIAKRMGARVYWQSPRGPGPARNIGAKKAKGSVFVFLDADSRLPKNFFSTLDKNLDGKVGGGIFSLKPYDAESSEGFITYNIAVSVARFFISLGHPLTIGSCFVYRKNVFERTGGFDESMVTNEDHDLAVRAHKIARFVFLEGATVEVSMRRVRKWGLFKSTMVYLASTLLFFFGKGTLRWYWDK
ncbi:MAG: glycosyltransferase [Candidatus Aenigmarchaeota archaeon]|nr:glycosyltransferase [Candidatus Aenigmarchaeota archaeon]